MLTGRVSFLRILFCFGCVVCNAPVQVQASCLMERLNMCDYEAVKPYMYGSLLKAVCRIVCHGIVLHVYTKMFADSYTGDICLLPSFCNFGEASMAVDVEFSFR